MVFDKVHTAIALVTGLVVALIVVALVKREPEIYTSGNERAAAPADLGRAESSGSAPERPVIPPDVEAVLKAGDVQALSQRLAEGLDANAVDPSGETLLNRAVMSGSLPMIEAVLNAGADPNAPGKDDTRPLVRAAGQEAVVALLLKRGAGPWLYGPHETVAEQAPPAEARAEARVEAPPAVSSPPSDTKSKAPANGAPDSARLPQDRDPASREALARGRLGESLAVAPDAAGPELNAAPEPPSSHPVASDQSAPNDNERFASRTPPAASPPTPTSLSPPSGEPAPAVSPPAAPAESPAPEEPKASPGEPVRFEPPAQAPARPSAGEPVRSPAERARIAQAQTRLAQLGYHPGAADGDPGPQTQAAVRAFQKARGLPTDGRISDSLLAALNAELAARDRKPSPTPAPSQNPPASPPVASAARPTPVQQAPQPPQSSPQRPPQIQAPPQAPPANPDLFTKVLSELQRALGHDFDSVERPQEIRAYCRQNRDSWIYDVGRRQYLYCRDVAGPR